MTKRPASHFAAAFYFVLMAGAFALAAYRFHQIGDAQMKGQIAMLVPFLIGLVGIFGSSRWSYYYCSILVAALPAFLIFSAGVIILSKPNALASISPMFVGVALMGWLFYAFTFGDASRVFYGFSPK